MADTARSTEITRNGGDLVVETLEALGATTAFGIPGQHALGLFDALSRSQIRFISSRVENNAAFAADGYSRVTGQPGVLFLSTGPGALTSLAGLQEAYATGVPMVVVSSQIPSDGLGGRRRGMIHQLDDQKESVRNVTKDQVTVLTQSGISPAVQDAWSSALTAPQGPVWVEVPQDVLLASTSLPPVSDVLGCPGEVEPLPGLVEYAAETLAGSPRTTIVAGGGVRRAGAEAELLALAERLGAPVVCSPGGIGAFPADHPLALGFIEDRAITEVLEDASVLLVLGSSLGEVTSNYYTCQPRGQVVQVDAEARVLGSNARPDQQWTGIRSDAQAFLSALLGALPDTAPDTTPDWSGRTSTELVAAVNAAVDARLDAQNLEVERRFMTDIRAAVPSDMPTFWDMTIASYWAWNVWDGSHFHSAQGAGGLGYGFPSAIGGAVGNGQRVLAVAGDGSAMYSIAELASARQDDVPVTWLIVDDGGYGILREYMTDAFGQATATELSRPDFVMLAQSFGVPAERVTTAGVGAALDRALGAPVSAGPNVVVVDTYDEALRMWEPTHLG